MQARRRDMKSEDNRRLKIEDLPEIMTAQDIASYLSISRRKVYELFQITVSAGGIKNFDIGFSKRVEKQDLINWVEARKLEKERQSAG
jgi:excisionase family DNA binding protein